MDNSSYQLERARYGKDGIRVITAVRQDGHDHGRELGFSVRVSGSFDASYWFGDNSSILPSDTLRRHVLATVAADPGAALESLTIAAAHAILAANPAVDTAAIDSEELGWGRIGEHTFLRHSPSLSAGVVCSRGAAMGLTGSLRGVAFLATRGSAFTGFLSDPLTVQPEASDRPLYGTLEASWAFAPGHMPAADTASEIVTTLEQALSDRPSNAVQQLITEVSAELLAARAELISVTLGFASLPLARLPVDLPGVSAGGGQVYELGVGSPGVTESTLRRM